MTTTGTTTTLATPPPGLTQDQLARPSVARMYDYYLGGHHNFASDRAAAEAAIAIFPGFPLVMQANRAFLRRAVQFLVGQGIEQFVDIGSGIPTVGNVHQIAQQANPDARVVYVDVDPVAVAHSAAMLVDNPRATIIEADARQPELILANPAVRSLLDFGKPVALILAFVLHFLVDDDEAVHVVRVLREALPLGSYMLISHGTTERVSVEMNTQMIRLYAGTSHPVRVRSKAQIAAYFAGLEMVEPGLVYVPTWRPEEPDDLLLDNPEGSIGLAGIGRKL